MRTGGAVSGRAGAREAALRRRAARGPARNEAFAPRKLRHALPAAENLAAGGAARAAVWPQRAKFSVNGGTTARPGDPSRCAAGAGMPEAAPGNAAAAPRGAAKRSGEPAALPAGDGPRFAGRGCRRKGGGKAPKGSRRPAAPGGDLPERGADLASGRRCRPRSGVGPGRLFRTGEAGSRAARARRNSPRSAASGGSAARRTPAAWKPRPRHFPPERARGRSRKTARAGRGRTRTNTRRDFHTTRAGAGAHPHLPLFPPRRLLAQRRRLRFRRAGGTNPPYRHYSAEGSRRPAGTARRAGPPGRPQAAAGKASACG